MQPVLQIEAAVSLHDMREQVTVERRVLGEQMVERQLALGGDELIEPHRPRRDLGPLFQREPMLRIRPTLPDRLEDHERVTPLTVPGYRLGATSIASRARPVTPVAAVRDAR